MMEGIGKMLVTAVGMHSQAGVMMKLLGATEGTSQTSFCPCCVNMLLYNHRLLRQQGNTKS